MTDQVSETLLKDLGDLYGALKHGDDTHLLAIMRKNGFKLDDLDWNKGYRFIPLTPDEPRDSDPENDDVTELIKMML